MKKLIPIMIAAAMLCVVFVAADTDAADPGTLWINGHEVTTDTTNDAEHWSYVASTNTITLNGVALSSTHDFNPGWGTIVSPILYTGTTGTLNIVLVGSNTLGVANPSANTYGIFLNGAGLNISGSGSLVIEEGCTNGINGSDNGNDITIDGGDITIGALKSAGSSAIYGTNIIVNAGIIRCVGSITGEDSAEMTGGCMIITVNGDGMFTFGACNDSFDIHGAFVDNGTIQSLTVASIAAGDVIISHMNGKTVTFNVNGGTCSTASKTTNAEGKIDALPDATRDGYTFDGWFTAATGGDKIVLTQSFTQDTTVYAHWSGGPSDDGDKKTNTGLIVGGVIGGIVVVAIIAGLVVFFMKKQ